MAATLSFHVRDWDPIELLQINNIEHHGSFCCVGYAKGRGRRCHQPINQENRATVRTIIQGLPDICTSEQQLRRRLRQAAPLALCKRWHQGQMDDVVNKWYGLVKAEVQRRQSSFEASSSDIRETAATSSANQERAQDNGTNSSGNAGSTVEGPELSGEGEQARPGPSSGSNEPQTQRSASSPNPASDSPSDSESTNSDRRRPQETPVEEVASHPEDGRRETAAITSSTRTPTGDNRRAMEEDCPICCKAYEADEAIVWCRAACGNNMHKDCFDEWAAFKRNSCQEVTCPFCRTAWDRKPLDGECPICRDDFSTGDEVVWCRATCGNNVHKACFDQWADTRRSSHQAVTCPFCRTDWQSGEGSRSHGH